jgi:hypothetical protein
MAMPFFDKPDARDGGGWIMTYCHVAGIIQCFYAAFFGKMCSITFGDGQFYHPAFQGKGEHSPAYFDYSGLFFTTVFALLAVTGFIGGLGVLRLRPWVRRWEAAYLGVLLIGAAAAIVADMSRGFRAFEDFTPLMLFSVAFALPFLPFLCEDVVASMAKVARLRVRRVEPVAASVGVRDAWLDG